MNRLPFVKATVMLVMLVAGNLLSVSAQDTTNTMGHVSIASPTAASLGKYGDIPVGYNTGTPQVSIPIYTAQSGSLKLPVSLSYHASGLKVQENASWVGAGWSLNAGGVITRTVIGQPDDRGLGGYNNCQYGHYSDYGFNSYQWISGSGFGAVNGMVADDYSFRTGVKDGEPDLYFFNFGGYNGKFYFNDDRTPILVPEEDFKITPDLNNAGMGIGFQGFIVTTSDGIKYYFGKTGSTDSVAPVEVTIVSTLQSGPAYNNAAVSSWFLNKIVSADGMDSIKLNYHTEQYSYYTMSMFPRSSMVTGGFLTPDNSGYSVVKNFVQGIRLSGISFSNGRVDFIPSALARTDLAGYTGQAFTDDANTQSFSLGSIRISDSRGFCKKDSLYYGYFYDPNPLTVASTYNGYNIHSDAYRLRLDSIQEQTCDVTLKIPSYKFSYYTELVPRKLSFGMDHWGFSNGVLANSSLVPTYTLLHGNDIDIFNGANRDAGWPAMRGGSLKKITYPTGGYSAMNFEANDTYVNYNVYTKPELYSASVGYGTEAPNHFSITTDNASVFEVVMSSSSATTSNPVCEIYTTGGTFLTSTTVAYGGYNDTTYVSLSPSTTYNCILYNGGGAGTTSATFYENLATAVQGNVTVGGLRIKSDTTNDGLTSNNIIKSYTYTNGGASSSGILYSKPVYVQSLRNNTWALVYGPDGGSLNGCPAPDLGNPLGNGGIYYISPTSITPMSTFQGNHIGYNQVQVSEQGNGYSVYRYYGSNIWDNQITDVCTRLINTTTCPLTIPNYPAPPQPFEPLRGELKYEAHFNQSGQPLSEIDYSYSYASDPLGTPGIIYSANTGFFVATLYSLQSARKTQTSVQSTTFDPATSSALTSKSTSYYGSPWHHQVTRKVTSTSTGDSLITNIKYALDFRIPTCDAIPDSLTYFLGVVRNDSVVMDTMITHCPTGINGPWWCRYDTVYDLLRFVSVARMNFINYRRRSYADTNNLLSSCYSGYLGTADPLLRPILRLQNEFNNTPIETTQYKDLNLLHAGYTQYDTSQAPLGFAYPGRTQMINLQTPSGTFTNAAISGNTISKDSRYLDESTFKFTSGNPVQVTGHDGLVTSYLWDYQNKEPVAKVMGATVDQVAYTSFEADGSGSWTIGSSLRDTTTAITGKSSYNLSNGACSRSSLTSASTYIVSYWSKTGASYTVAGSSTTKKGKAILINGSTWTYFEHTVTGTTSVSVTGSGNIDELRLYPSTAQMMTYTYSPLVGMTSQCDVNNRVTYYFYDGLARLQTIRDQDYNVLKKYDYQYQASAGCGANCSILPMQNLAGNNTLSYPVGVFNVSGKLLGNATSQSQYISLWNADTADTHRGTLSAGVDSMHFQLAAVTGQTLPASVTGCRYYQFDLPWTLLDGIENRNAVYFTFGDGTGMYMGKTYSDTTMILPANTTLYHLVSAFNNDYYIEHTYPDTSLKTLTFYHNDGTENSYLDNAFSPAVSLSKLKNLRGNLPQRMTILAGSSYQQASASTVASITNWNSLQSITTFNPHSGDAGVTPTTHMSYAQDFMVNNQNLQTISTSGASYYRAYYRDTTFKISRLKSDWNTYFSNLQSIFISDEHWNRENLTGLTHLSTFGLVCATQLHTNNTTGNPPIPIPANVLDNIIMQIAAGAGQYVSNGNISLITGGTTRTTASDSAITFLQSKGWVITLTN